MFAGFPELPLAKPDSIDLEHESKDDDGCVNTVLQPDVQKVSISYPALCHLLSISTNATRRRAMFGRLYGLQLKDEIQITEVQPNPAVQVPREDSETTQERQRRMKAEEEAANAAFDKLQALYVEESIDFFQVGNFAICCAMFNPFSITALKHLMALHEKGQPALLIYYDPFRTAIFGRPYLRAYVPTKEYIAYHELEKKGGEAAKRNTLSFMRDSKVTTHGVLREVPVSIELDAYHKLGLAKVAIDPVASPFHSIQSDAADDYTAALVQSLSSNSNSLKSSLEQEGRWNMRMGMPNAPLAQKIDTLLAIQHLREQTLHLEAVCDSVLLNSSMLRDI